MANKYKNNTIIKAGFSGFFLLLIAACGSHKKASTTTAPPIVQTVFPADTLKIINPELEIPIPLPSPSNGIVTLGSDTINVGTHVQGDTLETVFYFTVNGNEKIKILQVHPGCQCTAPVFPKDSIAPNTIDSIVLVVYTARVHLGPFNKSAYVLNAVREVDYFVQGTLQALPAGQKPKKYYYTNKQQ